MPPSVILPMRGSHLLLGVLLICTGLALSGGLGWLPVPARWNPEDAVFSKGRTDRERARCGL